MVLSQTTLPTGASWGKDGNIVLASGQSASLLVRPADGGPPRRLTKLGSGEVTHRWPQVLPDGDTVLFAASPNIVGLDRADIEAVSLKTGQVKLVQHGGYYGRYLPSGHLVFVHQGRLFGVSFDPARLEVRGTPIPVVEDVAGNSASGGGQFDISGAGSGSGTLVYLAGNGSTETWTISWLSSSGTMQPLISTPGIYTAPSFSPDGKKLAVINGGDIYVYDLEQDAPTRLTFSGNARGLTTVWTPDGKHIAFRAGSGGISWISSDGAGEPQLLLDRQGMSVPWSFSPDGRRLAYYDFGPTGLNLWTLPLDLSNPEHPKPGKPEAFLSTPAAQIDPRFSPDGRWMAYRSNESGNNEIYVRPFPAGSRGKWQVTNGGGLFAFWSKNGRELFYETADNRIMALDYSAQGGSFMPRKPRLWSAKQIFFPGVSNLDLAPDGKRFAVLTSPEATRGEKGSVHVTMLLNFFDELRRRVPVNK